MIYFDMHMRNPSIAHNSSIAHNPSSTRTRHARNPSMVLALRTRKSTNTHTTHQSLSHSSRHAHNPSIAGRQAPVIRTRTRQDTHTLHKAGTQPINDPRTPQGMLTIHQSHSHCTRHAHNPSFELDRTLCANKCLTLNHSLFHTDLRSFDQRCVLKSDNTMQLF